MMEEEQKNKLENQQELLEKIYISTEKTRKYFLWTLIVTVALVVLPALGLAIAIPKFIDTYTTTLGL